VHEVVNNNNHQQRMQTTIPLFRAAAIVSATVLLSAVLAPGPIFAAGRADSEEAAKASAPGATTLRKHVSTASSSDDGDVGQVPEMGQTQLPYTPDTPRAHYDKAPAHLP
jgi:hypothetical protein